MNDVPRRASTTGDSDPTVLPARLQQGKVGWWLDVMTPDGQNWQKTLLHGESLIIGRDRGLTVPLADGQASRQHARMWQENGVWRIEDLKSHNGTKVNDRAITGVTTLQTGDTIQIGKSLLTLNKGESLPTPPANTSKVPKPTPKIPPLLLGLALVSLIMVGAAVWKLSQKKPPVPNPDPSATAQPVVKPADKTPAATAPSPTTLGTGQVTPEIERLLAESKQAQDQGKLIRAYERLVEADLKSPNVPRVITRKAELKELMQKKFSESHKKACKELDWGNPENAMENFRTAIANSVDENDQVKRAREILDALEKNPNAKLSCN